MYSSFFHIGIIRHQIHMYRQAHINEDIHQSLRQLSFLIQIKEYLIHDMILNIIQHRLFIRNNRNITDCFFRISTFIIDHHSGKHVIPVWLHQTVQCLFCFFSGCDHQKFTPFFAVMDPFSDHTFPSESSEPHCARTDRI